MELNEQDKERIIAEEKLRMETRKEFFKEHFGGGHWGGPWCGSWASHGCHGYRCGGFGFFKGLLLAAVIFGLFHMWHRPCYAPNGYGYCPPVQQQTAPNTQPPVKN